MLPKTIQNLISELSKFPSVGPRTAARYVFWLLKQPNAEVEKLGETIKNLKSQLRLCKTCFNYSDQDICAICSDSKRSKTTICVVEDPLDIPPIERTSKYNGVYHVLGGLINPQKDIGPENLRVKELIQRVKDPASPAQEIIIALNPTTYGDATSLHLVSLLKPMTIKTTRLARGLPTGADMEYADEITLSQALDNRTEY